jgi:hypothetical protein
LPKAIEKIECRNLSVREQLEIFNKVRSKLKGDALKKLEESLNKNHNLISFTSESNSSEFRFKTLFAPLTSSEVERSFSQYSNIFTLRRNRFKEINIEKYDVIKFNAFLDN